MAAVCERYHCGREDMVIAFPILDNSVFGENRLPMPMPPEIWLILW